MKAKILLRFVCVLLFLFGILFSLAACSRSTPPEDGSHTAQPPSENESLPKEEGEPPAEEPPVTHTWRDADGTLLHRGEEQSYPLPADTEKWDYTEWEKGESEGEYVAVRTPQSSYFAGNVFQIIVSDLDEQPVATGSAFVFNQEGWFITNAHVMQDAYYAQAVFNLPNPEKGESYTYLNISMGSFHHADKDIYIGKLEGFDAIQAHYNEIPITPSYEQGDETYSVGYPNSATNINIHKGEITESWSDLNEKLYSANTYICSSSYIAPGSSGGILTNGALEVIGITTLGWFGTEKEFISGAAISAFNFIPLLTEYADDDKLISVQERFHAEKAAYIAYFNEARDAAASGETRRQVYDDGAIGYTYEREEEESVDGTLLYKSEQLTLCDDGWISYSLDYCWDVGDRRVIAFYGYYNHEKGLVDFTYEFKYTFRNGSYYTVYSNDINYSESLSLTLNNYRLSSSFFYQPKQEDVNYAKANFNYVYEYLTADIARFQ